MAPRKRPPALKNGPEIDLHLVLDGELAVELKARALAADRPLTAEIRRGLRYYLENTEAA